MCLWPSARPSAVVNLCLANVCYLILSVRVQWRSLKHRNPKVVDSINTNCNAMSNILGNWGHWLGQIAEDVATQVDDQIHNVEQIVRTAVNNSAGSGLAGAASGRGPQNIEDILNQDKRQGPEQPGSSGHFFMGNGGVSGPSSPTSGAPFCSSTTTTNMNGEEAKSKTCDHCSSKFKFFNKKKTCYECRDQFCSNCIVMSPIPGSKSNRYLCVCCNVLSKRPLVRSDLMELRIKDLQKHLVRKKINSKSCVEKKDLVELIMRESFGGGPQSTSSPTSPTGRGPGDNLSGGRPHLGPVERQSSFPKAYVDSSHRREWFEKLDNAKEEDTAKDEDQPVNEEDKVFTMEKEADDDEPMDVDEVTPVVKLEEEVPPPSPPPTTRESPKPSEEVTSENDDEKTKVKEEAEVTKTDAEPTSDPAPDGAVGGSSTLRPTSEPRPIPADLGSLSASSSPSRRFARQGLVRLDEIDTLDDLNLLSAKQCKDLLAMNRVNFHGIIEKEELMKIVERLWRQEKKAQKEKDTMEDTDLCKICWDAAVDCVMLECGHMATCTNCGKQLAECPICRQYVVRVVRTFKA